MKRMMMAVAVLAALALVAAPMVQAAEHGDRPAKGHRFEGAKGDRAEGWQRGEGAGKGPMPEGRRPGPAMFMVLAHAVTAPWAKDNADVQALVDKVVAGAKALPPLEQTAIAAAEKVLAGARAGKTREELQADIEALKTADQALGQVRETLMTDMRSLGEKMRELAPERPQGEGAGRPEGQGGPRPEGGKRPEGGRRPEGGKRPQGGDFPPVIE